MIHTNRKFVVLLAGLLFVVAQFESLVHAAEHPFHADDEICAPFASFEKHDHAIAVLPATNSHPRLACDSVTGIDSTFVDNRSLIYQSRAPPLHT